MSTENVVDFSGMKDRTGDDASSVSAPTSTIFPDAPKAEPLDITADEIFKAPDHRVIAVPVDEWKKGAFVYIHTPSSADKDNLEQVILRDENEDGTRKRIEKDEVRAAFVAMCTKNSKGERIFNSYADIQKLKQKSIAPMDRIYQAVLDAVVITEADVEVMAKNSGAVSSDNS